MGIRAPFETVVARHGAVVLRVCRALLGDAEADDAWAETFLAALRAYPRLPVEANVRGWLVTIAHRKAIDLLRAQRRRPGLASAERADERSSGDPTLGPELLHSLQTLAPKQREAITYHHLAGLPYDEVAALLGGTAAAARRAASDGIAALRVLYGARRTRRDRR